MGPTRTKINKHTKPQMWRRIKRSTLRHYCKFWAHLWNGFETILGSKFEGTLPKLCARENLCTSFARPCSETQRIEKHGWDEGESEAKKSFFPQSCNHKKNRVFFIHRVCVPTFMKPCLIIIASRKVLVYCLWSVDMCVRSLDIFGRGVMTAKVQRRSL